MIYYTYEYLLDIDSMSSTSGHVFKLYFQFVSDTYL